ncbi:LytTR family DNA-binding domain-containing protein [Leeuwenhoekiella marinoflava]|uniref:LytR/AlgR family response regulator transcription factor n=1 Tax=Leeuwenhoekiella marinoflava TaxID=988 RepID=UPI0030012341
MISAIAIDDEPKAIKVICSHTEKISELNLIRTFTDPQDARAFLKENLVDLIFLDINMPHLSGFDLLEELKLKPLLIFTTAYSDYAVKSYEHNAVDYLLKPFNLPRFYEAIEKVKVRLNSINSQKTDFFIKDGFATTKIKFEDIIYIKGSGNYLDIVTIDKTHSPRMTFTEILQKLNPSQFLRVHQSYLVSINMIEKIENNHISIYNQKIAISKKYREAVFKKLNLD